MQEDINALDFHKEAVITKNIGLNIWLRKGRVQNKNCDCHFKHTVS